MLELFFTLVNLITWKSSFFVLTKNYFYHPCLNMWTSSGFLFHPWHSLAIYKVKNILKLSFSGTVGVKVNSLSIPMKLKAPHSHCKIKNFWIKPSKYFLNCFLIYFHSRKLIFFFWFHKWETQGFHILMITVFLYLMLFPAEWIQISATKLFVKIIASNKHDSDVYVCV